MIDELNTLAQQLDTENQQQAKSKTDRKDMAQKRIALHNTVWDIMTEVQLASTLVFANDYARQRHFALYPGRKKKVVSGKVINLPGVTQAGVN